MPLMKCPVAQWVLELFLIALCDILCIGSDITITYPCVSGVIRIKYLLLLSRFDLCFVHGSLIISWLYCPQLYQLISTNKHQRTLQMNTNLNFTNQYNIIHHITISYLHWWFQEKWNSGISCFLPSRHFFQPIWWIMLSFLPPNFKLYCWPCNRFLSLIRKIVHW